MRKLGVTHYADYKPYNIVGSTMSADVATAAGCGVDFAACVLRLQSDTGCAFGRSFRAELMLDCPYPDSPSCTMSKPFIF
jgi:hypothetical protein